jgi:hypothetical protein
MVSLATSSEHSNNAYEIRYKRLNTIGSGGMGVASCIAPLIG